MCKWAFLDFPSIYLVLAYKGYTNADVSPSWMGTQLSSLPSRDTIKDLVWLGFMAYQLF